MGLQLPFLPRGSDAIDLAVDLGTANTLVYLRGQGIVLTEPSVVAVEERTGEVVAVGALARRMLGRTPATITATRPLRDGVIHDIGVTQQMLRHFIARALDGRRGRPRVMVCVPSGLTPLERRAVLEAADEAGAREALLIAEPMAAAIGTGLPVGEPVGQLIVDMGGGTTEVAGHRARGHRDLAVDPGRRRRPATRRSRPTCAASTTSRSASRPPRT